MKNSDSRKAYLLELQEPEDHIISEIKTVTHGLNRRPNYTPRYRVLRDRCRDDDHADPPDFESDDSSDEEDIPEYSTPPPKRRARANRPNPLHSEEEEKEIPSGKRVDRDYYRDPPYGPDGSDSEENEIDERKHDDPDISGDHEHKDDTASRLRDINEETAEGLVYTLSYKTPVQEPTRPRKPSKPHLKPVVNKPEETTDVKVCPQEETAKELLVYCVHTTTGCFPLTLPSLAPTFCGHHLN